MHAQDMIKLNNEKREKLNEINLKYYEDMLVYIRLSGSLSEQQTEEILLELLDHLLVAQTEDKTAIDIFGDNLQAYCNEIINELPKEDKKNTLMFFTYIIMFSISLFLISYSGLGYVLSLFNIGETTINISVGKSAILFLILALTILTTIMSIFKSVRNDAFKKDNSQNFHKEAIIIGILTGLFSIPYLIAIIFLPDFGKVIEVPVLYLAVFGIILYALTFILNKKYRITK